MGTDLFGICPYATAQRLLSGKWTLLILYQLSVQTLRFGELQRKLPDLTQATLSKQLRIMEAENLIVRTSYNQIPPKVEYSLSELGKHFHPVLKAVEAWGEEYINYMKQRETKTEPGDYPGL